MTPSQYYKKDLEITEQQLQKIKRKLAVNGSFRLVAFLCILGFLFGLVQINITLAISLSMLSLVVFGVLIKYHVGLLQQKKYATARALILKNELEACKHNFSTFADGEAYKNSQHYYTNDLDVFGKGSLFQMLNRTVTESGEKILANKLASTNISIEDVLKLQESVKELSGNPELLLHFRSTGSVSETAKEDKSKLKAWKDTSSYVNNYTFLNVARYLLPALSLGSLLILVFSKNFGSIFTSLFVFNLVFTGFFMRKTNKEHSKLGSFHKVISNYQSLLQIFEGETFKSDLLIKLSKEIKSENQSAASALKELTKTVNSFDNRLNFMAAIFLEGILLWDFHCLYKLETWRRKYGSLLLNWIDNLAQFDTYISMATFAYNNPNFSYSIPKPGMVLQGTALGHPFLPDSVRVNNDFSIDKKGCFVIITGANMAGKSTFLRTIGVNFILASMGLPVCAEKFEFTPRNLFTSMRTSDSLNENESYFYAELKRMKELIDRLETGDDLFIMLDEILKGTNSIDKQKGSQLALEKILLLKGTGVIATHDLALTEMDKLHPHTVKNQCFEIEIDNAKISFDYKLYMGVTQNMNAMLLMQQMGIV